MSKKKLTEGLIQRANGQYVRAEKIDGIRRYFTSFDPAEVWKKRDAALLESKNKKAEADAGPLFEEVSGVYEESVRNMPYGTAKAYLPAIRRANKQFSGSRIKDIEPYEIADFLKTISSMARTTVLNQKTVLNGIFQTWVDSPKWHGTQNTAKATSTPHGLKSSKREPPSEDQVKIVKDHYMDRDALPAVVYLCTGERKGEACGIQLEDVDFDNGTISITKHVELRGNKPHMLDGTKTPAGVRKIPLLQMLREALEPLRNMPPRTYILGCGKKPLSGSQYARLWVSFWRKYGMAHSRETAEKHLRNGVPKFTKRTIWTADVCAHQFRHEYVCMLAEADVPEAIAIQIVGHANAKMIHEVYMSLKPKMVDDTRARLDTLLTK